MHCLRRIIPALIIMMACQWAQGQRQKTLQHPKTFKREISLISDNDNYNLQKRDGYYTNGFNFSFQKLAIPHDPRTQKVIMRYEVGQKIFNPRKYSITDPALMDRPFAGYLYVKVSRSRFFKSNANLQYGVMLGLLGPSSGAQSIQRSYHKLINIYEVQGWGYQLKSEASINLQAQYTHPLLGSPKRGFSADLHGVTHASLGNAFTNAAGGVLFRMGLIEDADQSAAWNSRLHSSTPAYHNRHEAFLFFQPEILYQAYNATMEGGLFRKDKGPVVADVNPVLYQHRLGLVYVWRPFTVSFAIIHRTREVKHQYRKENYASIGVSYRMK
jgi:lipid A 3-O-deacylase